MKPKLILFNPQSPRPQVLAFSREAGFPKETQELKGLIRSFFLILRGYTIIMKTEPNTRPKRLETFNKKYPWVERVVTEKGQGNLLVGLKELYPENLSEKELLNKDVWIKFAEDTYYTWIGQDHLDIQDSINSLKMIMLSSLNSDSS